MLVVIPFHSGDKPQAISLANWIKELGQVSDHKCLLCVGEHCDESGVIEPLHASFKSVSVYLPHAKAKRSEGKMGYARAANAMWQSVAWKIYMQDKCPWLWLEPDAIPTRPSWLREIEDEYRTHKKPFLGAMGQCQIPMINGVAVYPAAVCDYAPLALQAAECPWDLNAAEQILKHAHVTDLFQHIYQITGEPPTFPKDADRLNQSAALFHRCKDSSLIAHLKQVGYTSGKRGDASCGKPEVLDNQSIHPQSKAAQTVRPACAESEGEEGLGEPLDYSKRLEEFDRTKPKIPSEGERNGDLVWRGGKWHTAAPMVETKTVDRKAVMEKFAHPEKTDLPVPVLAAPSLIPVSPGEARESTSQKASEVSQNSRGGQNPSRDDIVQEAVSVLKKLCSAPRFTAKIRKELKRQGVVK